MTRMMQLATTLAITAAMAWSTTSLAATAANVTLSPDKRIVYAPPTHHLRIPRKVPNGGWTVLFDNFATRDPLGVYMVGTGYALGGPTSPIGLGSVAAAFTPARNATVTTIEVAAGFISGAKNAVLVTIYADASGAPGTTLWQGKAHMPIEGDCCATVTVPLGTGLSVKAGSQYWLGLSAPSNNPDIFAAWNFNVADQIDPGLMAFNIGAGWMPSSVLPNVAFAVYGN